MKFSRNTLKLIALLLALVALAAAAFGYWQKQRGNAAERYRTATVDKGDVTQTVSANGTLNPVVLVNVGTQVSGTVKKLYVDFNDRVQQGQVLAELDPSVLQAQVRQSEANAGNMRAAYELAVANQARMRELHAQEYVSRQDLDQAEQALKSARAQLAQARAQLEKDRTNLGYTVIRSPVSGVVVDRQIDVGQTVAASFQTPTLFRIAQDLRKMQIDSSFAEADIGAIKVGQPVRFNVDAFPNRTFRGSVRQVRLNPTVQQNVVTYDVVVAVDNPEQILMPGMTAYVNIVVAERSGALLVPNAALRFKPPEAAGKAERPKTRDTRREGARGTVYVIEEGGRLRPVSIETGISDGRYTEVLGGDLAGGARVVTEDLSVAGTATQPAGGMRLRVF